MTDSIGWTSGDHWQPPLTPEQPLHPLSAQTREETQHGVGDEKPEDKHTAKDHRLPGFARFRHIAEGHGNGGQGYGIEAENKSGECTDGNGGKTRLLKSRLEGF